MALKHWPLLLALLALALSTTPARAARQPSAALDESYSDIVLVIDHSGSMRQNDPQFLRLAAAKLFIDLADPRDKISIVVMSDTAHTRPLTKQLVSMSDTDAARDLKNRIDALRSEPMGAETHMGTALGQAYSLLASTDREKIKSNQHQFVVLLSDGKPTGVSQKELVAQASAQFQERRYWKIFSIALGGEADPSYLEQAVAAPTSASVVIANRAEDLIDSYLEVYRRAGDDRFIDRIEVEPNMLTGLAQIQSDQQPTQLSVILIRGGVSTSINRLIGPDERDLVQPYYQNTIYRSAEPEYELYKVPPESQIRLDGDWQINVARADQTPTQIVLLTRSRLRIRMLAPAPIVSDDDSSVRYHPIGRPLLLVAGAEIAKRNPDTSQKLVQPYLYQWVAQMQPSARVIAPESGPTIALADDGQVYDTVAGDGRYAGLYPALATAGDYTVQIEMPRQTEQPTHITKQYVLRVTSLPTMTLTLPPDATLLPIHTSFQGLIDLPSRADFTIRHINISTAWVTRPDGVLDALSITPEASERFRFSYTPEFAGAYTLSAVAEVTGHGPMGDIRYVDYVEGRIAVPQVVPSIAVSAAFSSTLSYDGQGVVEVPLTIDSQAQQPEQLRIQVADMPGSSVIPATLLVAPHERAVRTIAVRLPEQRPKQGQITLAFDAPDQRVLVQGGQLPLSFRQKASLAWLVLLALGVAGALGWLLFRRYQRRKRSQTLLSAGKLARAPR